MRRSAFRGLLGVASVLVVCSCGSDSGGPATTTPDDVRPTGRVFVTTDADVPGGGPLTLDFTDDDRLLASAGCNSMNGPVRLDDGKLVATDLAMTEMACPPERMEADEWMSDLLLAEPAWEMSDDDTLVLTAGDLVVTLTDRDVVQPPAALTDQVWKVDTLIAGDVASSVPAGVEAFFTITSEGKITGSGGCNGFGGNVVIADGTVTFGQLGSTLVGCEADVAQVESHLLTVLQGEVQFAISGDRLTLTAESGDGLQATAG